MVVYPRLRADGGESAAPLQTAAGWWACAKWGGGGERINDFKARQLLEADHGKLKSVIRQALGFQSMKTTYAILRGFEVMSVLKTGQGSLFRYLPRIAGGVSLVHRAFGLS